MKLAIVLTVWTIAIYLFTLRLSVDYSGPLRCLWDFIIGFWAPCYWLITGREMDIWSNGEWCTVGFVVGCLAMLFGALTAACWSAMWVLGAV